MSKRWSFFLNLLLSFWVSFKSLLKWNAYLCIMSRLIIHNREPVLSRIREIAKKSKASIILFLIISHLLRWFSVTTNSTKDLPPKDAGSRASWQFWAINPPGHTHVCCDHLSRHFPVPQGLPTQGFLSRWQTSVKPRACKWNGVGTRRKIDCSKWLLSKPKELNF